MPFVPPVSPALFASFTSPVSAMQFALPLEISLAFEISFRAAFGILLALEILSPTEFEISLMTAPGALLEAALEILSAPLNFTYAV